MRTLVSFDWAIKRLLRQKANYAILEGFLSELLFEEIRIQNILESESNKENEDDKANQVDLLCENTKGELIIIEIQFYEETDYFQRLLYGTSKVITEYMTSGSPYGEVKKVYSVNILYFDLGQGSDYIYRGKIDFKGMHHMDSLQLGEHQKRKFDKIMPGDLFPEYVLIKVNNFNDVANNTLDEWIYFLKNTALTNNYKARGLDIVEQQLNYDNMDTTSKEKYDQYLKDFRISSDMLETARLSGKVEGNAEGKVEGKVEGKIEVIINGYNKGLHVSLISNIVSMTENEVLRILREHGIDVSK